MNFSGSLKYTLDLIIIFVIEYFDLLCMILMLSKSPECDCVQIKHEVFINLLKLASASYCLS